MVIPGSRESSTWESNLTFQVPTRADDVPPLSDTITDTEQGLQIYRGEQGT